MHADLKMLTECFLRLLHLHSLLYFTFFFCKFKISNMYSLYICKGALVGLMLCQAKKGKNGNRKANKRWLHMLLNARRPENANRVLSPSPPPTLVALFYFFIALSHLFYIYFFPLSFPLLANLDGKRLLFGNKKIPHTWTTWIVGMNISRCKCLGNESKKKGALSMAGIS